MVGDAGSLDLRHPRAGPVAGPLPWHQKLKANNNEPFFQLAGASWTSPPSALPADAVSALYSPSLTNPHLEVPAFRGAARSNRRAADKHPNINTAGR